MRSAKRNPSYTELSLMITYVSKIVYSDYKFELIGEIEPGIATGNVGVHRPDRRIDNFSFNKENAYRAKVRLTQDSTVAYEGYMYYRASCMNPVR